MLVATVEKLPIVSNEPWTCDNGTVTVNANQSYQLPFQVQFKGDTALQCSGYTKRCDRRGTVVHASLSTVL